MIPLLLTLLISLFTSTVVAQQEELPFNKPPENEVTIDRPHEFSLKADYFAGKKKSDAFLILHDCASDRTTYEAITKQLAEQAFHVLSLDLRGFGRSTSATFSHLDMKKRTKDIISYQQLLAQITSYWEEDVLAAYEFLRNKLDKSANISILASGCSSPFAVSAAEKMHVANMVMLTPKMDYAGKERYKNLTDIPTYFIASVHHIETYRTTKELFEWNGHSRTKLLEFKGDNVDAQLLRQNRTLASSIANWLIERAR